MSSTTRRSIREDGFEHWHRRAIVQPGPYGGVVVDPPASPRLSLRWPPDQPPWRAPRSRRQGPPGAARARRSRHPVPPGGGAGAASRPPGRASHDRGTGAMSSRCRSDVAGGQRGGPGSRHRGRHRCGPAPMGLGELEVGRAGTLRCRPGRGDASARWVIAATSTGGPVSFSQHGGPLSAELFAGRDRLGSRVRRTTVPRGLRLRLGALVDDDQGSTRPLPAPYGAASSSGEGAQPVSRAR